MTPFHLRQRVKDFFQKAASPSSPKGPAHSPPPVPPQSAPVKVEPPKAEPVKVEPPKAEPVAAAPVAAAPVAAAPKAAVPEAAAPVAAAPKAGAKADAKPELTPAEKAKEEERQRKHWARVRKGMLKWLVEQGGSASMADMHAHSEAKYFVAHRAFSRLMEEYTGEELVTYAGGIVELTASGREAAG